MSACIECVSWKTKVVETRRDTRYNFIWRRRRCDCGAEFATYEVAEENIGMEAFDPVNPKGQLKRR